MTLLVYKSSMVMFVHSVLIWENSFIQPVEAVQQGSRSNLVLAEA